MIERSHSSDYGGVLRLVRVCEVETDGAFRKWLAVGYVRSKLDGVQTSE